jgi:hypothetical protein
MKRILVFLVLISFALGQQTGSGPESIKGALTNLCDTSRGMLAVSTMLLFTMGIVLVAIGFVAFKVIKTENKIVKTGGMILIGLGAIVLVLGVISIISYMFAPSLVGSLTGATGSGSCG